MGRVKITPLPEVPPCEAGAPLPVVMATKHKLLLAYWMQEGAEWKGQILVHSYPHSPGLLALIDWDQPYAHSFGPPDEEIISGHPLAPYGLHPCGAFEVHHSPWLRSFEQMDRVHRNHSPQSFAARRHFILTFHDSSFEVIAEDFSVSVHEISHEELNRLMLEQVARHAR